MLSEIYFRAKK